MVNVRLRPGVGDLSSVGTTTRVWKGLIMCLLPVVAILLLSSPIPGGGLRREATASSTSVSSEAEARRCREDVFVSGGQGGLSTLTGSFVDDLCADPRSYGVCSDLRSFTGLTQSELDDRLRRRHNFHFEGEHRFWNPRTSTELAWYYSTSVNYLFANALHPARVDFLSTLERGGHEPVLDYSGGVGNNVLYLAGERNMTCTYFGIGMAEHAFARYRVRRRGLDGKVRFLEPQSAATGWEFDPVGAALPRDGSLGAILAVDVLEHVPRYHLVVEAMVESLKVGGVIVEQTPFDNSVAVDGGGKEELGEDTRVHVSDGGIKMKDAMGPKMRFDGALKGLIKINPQGQAKDSGT